MNPRQIASRLARRTSRAIAVTALALGIVAGAAPLSPAVAAPLDAPKGPDLIAGTLYFNSVERGERVNVPILVKNNGTETAHAPQVAISSHFFSNTKVSGRGWSCKTEVGETTYGPKEYFLCSAWEIGAGEVLPLTFTGTKQWGDASITVNADPNKTVRETNEDNNFSMDRI